MAKNSKKTTKTIVESAPVPKFVKVHAHLQKAQEELRQAFIVADQANAPKEVGARINSLNAQLVKSTNNIQKKLDGMAGKAAKDAAKVVRAEAAGVRKAVRLEKMIAAQKALATKIEKLQK